MRTGPLIFAGRELLRDWSVVDRLGEIRASTLVVAGEDDVVFPPACQHELAGKIPDGELLLVHHAGHNPHDEQPEIVLAALRRVLTAA